MNSTANQIQRIKETFTSDIRSLVRDIAREAAANALSSPKPKQGKTAWTAWDEILRDPLSPDAALPLSRDEFICRRRAAASAYPSEFVVLLGTRVFFHSRDREEALAQYDIASAAASKREQPALVEPGKRPHHRDPVVRGRLLARRAF